MEINWVGLKDYLIARAKERSTWLGLVSLFAAAGVTIEPELLIAIATSASTLAGLILVAVKDKKPVEITEVVNENTIVVTSKAQADTLKKALEADVIVA